MARIILIPSQGSLILVSREKRFSSNYRVFPAHFKGETHFFHISTVGNDIYHSSEKSEFVLTSHEGIHLFWKLRVVCGKSDQVIFSARQKFTVNRKFGEECAVQKPYYILFILNTTTDFSHSYSNIQIYIGWRLRHQKSLTKH